VGRLLGRTHPRIIHPSTHKQNAHPRDSWSEVGSIHDLTQKDRAIRTLLAVKRNRPSSGHSTGGSFESNSGGIASVSYLGRVLELEPVPL